jgi:CBS domain-containing protein
MLVKDAMTANVVNATPRMTVQQAAAAMKERDVGILPVMESRRALGVITDRDIALRCCAEGRDPGSTTVAEIMTREVIDCRETRTLQDAGDLMEKNHVRRVLVTNDSDDVVGVLSLDDLAKRVRNPILTNEVIREVSTIQPEEP